ncbi:hypothetical protein DVK85_09775 [Flavobacterium arcticum]|uniref:Uncharacterized protein n=1 Tax=Flavobacterium arcticum TaxID=1784713 RepID=A0A345HD46_9FLAO|nr:hypothetical protein [Flavobacterium arcticum]AXG74506.1 hypothetical protein DVK85_09775 [Flavobacterium arcticum]KAF2512373.1 hypothetical protein E0W72_03885 [Flavobacterium arcticum]
MNNHIVLIYSNDLSVIKEAIREWIYLYKNKLEPSTTFNIYQIEEHGYLIELSKIINNDLFAFFVNYLTYSKKDVWVHVEGFTTAYNTGFDKSVRGKNIIMFIPETDDEYDVVYVVTEDNKSYKYDFGGGISKTTIDKVYSFPHINLKELKEPEIIVTTDFMNDKETEFSLTKWF